MVWDNIGTVHNAVANYTPDEPSTRRRARVMATPGYPAPVA